MTVAGGMLTVDEARARITGLAGRLPAALVPLMDAAGLVLSADVVAGRDLPGFDNSAMDGFAVRAEDVAAAGPGTPVRLKVAGQVLAGATYEGELPPGGAVRIMTGALIPKGADAVVEVEATEAAGGDVLVRLAAEPGRSFRRAGTDVAKGSMALPAGTHLGPAQLALLAALGVARPECVRRPKVAILATGDELVDVETVPGPGQVVDVVGPSLGAAVAACGAVPRVLAPARDSMDDLHRAFAEATEADLVITVGGVSMGMRDLVRDVVEELGELDFWRVAVRPGKPLAVGRVGGRPFIGLPGNPVSALVGFEVFVVPALMSMSGRAGWARPTVQAALAEPLSTPAGLRTFARARLEGREGLPLAWPAAGQASYQLGAMATANALLDIPEEAMMLEAGAEVTAILVTQPPAPPL